MRRQTSYCNFHYSPPIWSKPVLILQRVRAPSLPPISLADKSLLCGWLCAAELAAGDYFNFPCYHPKWGILPLSGECAGDSILGGHRALNQLSDTPARHLVGRIRRQEARRDRGGREAALESIKSRSKPLSNLNAILGGDANGFVPDATNDAKCACRINAGISSGE